MSSIQPCPDCGNPPRCCSCDLKSGKTFLVGEPHDRGKPGLTMIRIQELDIFGLARFPVVILAFTPSEVSPGRHLHSLVPTLVEWNWRLLEDDLPRKKETEPYRTVIEAREAGKGPEAIAEIFNNRWAEERAKIAPFAEKHTGLVDRHYQVAQKGVSPDYVDLWIEMQKMGISAARAAQALMSKEPFGRDYPLDKDTVRNKLRRPQTRKFFEK